jgi:hypothetical protein
MPQRQAFEGPEHNRRMNISVSSASTGGHVNLSLPRATTRPVESEVNS